MMMPLLGVSEAVDDCISAFPIWDPSKDTSHTGMSATAQAGALRSNQAFVRRFFWRVKQALQRARHQRKPSGVIAIYCRSGRHRSVALGEILAHCLRRDGYVVNSPSHLCDYWWWGCPARNRPEKNADDARTAISAPGVLAIARPSFTQRRTWNGVLFSCSGPEAERGARCGRLSPLWSSSVAANILVGRPVDDEAGWADQMNAHPFMPVVVCKTLAGNH